MDKISGSVDSFNADTPDFYVFHAPYNKLVKKLHARLFLADARRKYEKSELEIEGGEGKNQFLPMTLILFLNGLVYQLKRHIQIEHWMA